MMLDIDRTFGDIHPDPAAFRAQLSAISKLTRQSDDLHKWSDNLRFITSNPDVRQQAAETREEKCLINNTQTTFDRDSHDSHDSHPTSTIRPSISQSCSCNSWSRRPVNPRASRLWVTHRDDAPRCPHFVAISYCWPQPSEDNALPTASYLLLSRAGEKKNDAPDEVIRRALEFANFMQLSAVWIDQECIDQSDREDKECGIQSIDLVYENAQVSLGLFSIVASEQRHLNFLEPGRLLRDLQASTEETLSVTNSDLWNFLEWIDSERWFTRAWCMQESWSAGPKMMLMIKYDTTLVKPESLGPIDGEVLVPFQALTTTLSLIVKLIRPRSGGSRAPGE